MKQRSSALKFTCVLALCLYSIQFYGQEVNEKYIDSVLIEVGKISEQKEKIDVVYELSRKISRLNSSETGRLFAYMDNTTEDDEVRMIFYHQWAPYISRSGDIEASKQMRRKGLALARRFNSKLYEFDFQQSLSNLYISLSKADSATYYIAEAEKIVLENMEELKHSHWIIDHNKANIQSIVGNYEAEGEYLESAWQKMADYPEHRSKGFLLFIIVDHFSKTKNFTKQAEYTELLMTYHNEKKLSTPDYHYPIESLLLKENTPEAIEDLKRVLYASDSLNNLNSLSATTTTLAQALIDAGKPEEAIPFLDNAIQKLDEANYPFNNSAERYLLREAYAALGDYENAYYGLLDQKQMEDSIRNSQVLTTIADLEIKYDTERKERELEKKAASQKLLFWILALVAISLVIISVFLYKNQKKNRLLARQKKLLEATIDEKNVLLKETHHRVKNSFQIVSSLLYLQSENMADKEAQIAIKEAQNRVRSMVLIHQKLYNKDQLVGINTKEYFNDLARDIFESHTNSDAAIDYSMNVEPMVLDIETITPIGLILNELITNVLKHAFDTTTEAKNMQINFHQESDKLVLSVEDNGVGMPMEVKESSFGIKLMKALAKKLKATLDFQPAPQHGTLATLHIKRYNLL